MLNSSRGPKGAYLQSNFSPIVRKHLYVLNLFHLFVLKNRYWYGNNGWGFQPQYYQPVQNEDTKEDKDSTTQKPAKESEFVSLNSPNYVLPTYLYTAMPDENGTLSK